MYLKHGEREYFPVLTKKQRTELSMVYRKGAFPVATVWLVCLLSAALPPFCAIAENWVSYAPALPAGARCMVDVARLHPTQFAVGFWEIDRRGEKVADKSGKKLLKYMEEHVGQIVVGPAGEPYIIDRHHLACILQRTGKSPYIFAIVEANFRSLAVDSFWKEMDARKWAYLYDENGKGPLDPKLLPRWIKDLKDDPYRSLAWAVRERGCFEKSDEPFAEFQWANFFRRKLPAGGTHATMERRIEEALRLCHGPGAAGLPGYGAESKK
jgi:hypothetical protein